MLLLAATIAALFWANSPWSDSYFKLWHANLTIGLAGRTLSHDLHFWVNDLLMAIFFFVVGLEIKREIIVGELASVRKAALPITAAVGGVVVPALIYLLFNAGGSGSAGWGIPMATDIAFALGVMSLLGDRVPLGLKVFLTALAIVDDIAAVLVIAVFYTAEIRWDALSLAVVSVLMLWGLNRLGVRRPLTFALGGCILWLAVLASGIHATIAGVALALIIPCRTRLDTRQFLRRSRGTLDQLEEASKYGDSLLTSEVQQSAVHTLEQACEEVQAPLQRMERELHPLVTFLVMPVFALANAGVVVSGDLSKVFSGPVTAGVILGLVLGKPAGIFLASWAAVRFGLATLPQGVTWRHIHGAGWLAGIGFTMSLFVAGLAFSDAELLTMSKLGILTASLCAGAVGSILLAHAGRRDHTA